MKTHINYRSPIPSVVSSLRRWGLGLILAGGLLSGACSTRANVGEPPQPAPGGTVLPPGSVQPIRVLPGGSLQYAPATNTPPTAGPLTLVAEAGVKIVTSRDARYDFGEVNLLDKTEVDRTFTLQNESKAPVRLQQLRPSCGCTSMFVGSQEANGVALPTLQPGQRLTVRAHVDLTKLGAGPLHKYVWVYIQDNLQPVAMLELHGALIPNAVFNPTSVDFGSVDAGTGRVTTLILHYDPRVAPHGKLPTVYSNSPAVEVHPMSSREGTAPALPTSAYNAALTRTRKFLVSLSKDAPMGSIHGVIAFLPPFAGSPLSREYQASVQTVPPALRNVLVNVNGQIVGDLSATPAALMISVPNPEQGQRLLFTLRGKSAAVFRNLKATCGSPWLSVRPSPSKANPSPGGGALPGMVTQIWEVSVSADAPSGGQRSQITFTLANGQRLSVPVTAYIFGKGRRL
jgi:hypothetical protein